MKSYVDYQSQVILALEQEKFAGRPTELYEPINYIMDLGGKRIRPVLCLMACDLFGGDLDLAIKPAIGLEVFHNFTLMHDDIMDKAEKRRGMQCVHLKWDEPTAILSGDLMEIKAQEYMLEVPDPLIRPVMKAFNETARKVCEGQQWDMVFESKKQVSIADYLEMISLKTAALLAGSLQIGAILASADEKDQKAIYDFGINLGISFQIQDDLLDAFGNAEKFGKKIGGDIRSNKKTYLLLRAYELADKEKRKVLDDLLYSGKFSDEQKIKKVKDLYILLGVKKEAESLRVKHFNMAIEKLMSIRADDVKKKPLNELAKYLIQREK